MADCTCPDGPMHDELGEKCTQCGGFACAYAGKGRARCPASMCDCFIEQFPDSPLDLHPDAFVVGIRRCQDWPVCGHEDGCP